MDRLSVHIVEEELIEILILNSRSEVWQDPLYMNIYSVSQVRQLVQTRENLLNEDYVRKNLKIFRSILISQSVSHG